MKNTKAIFLIVVGAFILATGFAFAEGGVAYQQLVNEYKGIEIPAPVVPAPGATKQAVLTENPVTGAALKEVPEVKAAPAAVVEPKPTIGQTVKKWVGANFSKIISAVAIGFLAFLVLGTGGAALAVGAAAFGFFFLMSKL